MEAHKVLATPLQLKPINQSSHLELLRVPGGNSNGATAAIFDFPFFTPSILRFFGFWGWFRGGQEVVILGGLMTENQKSPLWRHLYCAKVSKAVPRKKNWLHIIYYLPSSGGCIQTSM